MTWAEVERLRFDRVIISPGPGRPDRERDFGVSRDVILHAEVPVLGVCLGHQGIASVFGGAVVQVAPVHGRASQIIHSGDDLFRGIPPRFSAIRYHSLAVAEPLPPELRKISWSEDGTVMALRHATRPLWGVQFHPESICSEYGIELLRNFLAVEDAREANRLPSKTATQHSSGGATARSPVYRTLALPHPAAVLFRALFAREKYAFWLDSSLVTERNRFSWMGASQEVRKNAFDCIDRLLSESGDAPIDATGLPFPFPGGYVGYFGYECGLRHKHRSAMPDSLLLRVERFLAIDHLKDLLYIVGPEEWADEIENRIAAIPAIEAAPPRWNRGRPAACFRLPHEDYLERVRQCVALIEAGESYELCLTNQLCLRTDIPALDYYETLRQINPAPYSAYLQFDGIQVASTSPECFLRIDRGRKAESRPIKGTVRRGRDAAEDERLRNLLANDERYRAENLMIVDLVRHDLSRVCEVGSVRVPRLMEVETYETVHQLVSTIEGRLRPDATTGDCLRALFPGGSMTGAPKLRSIELLDELEPGARGIYSGCIGFLGFNGTADLSIVIRTAVFQEGRVSLGVGGAIVAQSDPQAEWDEMELKAQALLRAFELA